MTLDVEQQGTVLRCWLNRPERHNAFDGQMLRALLALLDDAAARSDVRAIVIGGRGGSFCAGADLAWMKSAAAEGDDSDLLSTLFERLNNCPLPIIGRIHGAVRGGGVGIVACCDIPLATAKASFALTEVRLGLAPAVISPYVVAKIGVGVARELFITGRRFEAAEAQHCGLINHLSDDEEQLDRLIATFAEQISCGGPLAVAACKQLALTVGHGEPSTHLSRTTGLIAALRVSDEGQEGMRAFLEKRKPRWCGGTQ